MDSALADAVHANYLAALELVADAAPGAARLRRGGLVLVDAGMGEPGLNVAALVPGAAPPPGWLEMAEGWFGAHGSAFRLAAREDFDADVIALAEARGYVEWFREPALARLLPLPDGDAAAACALEVRAVRSPADAERYARVEPGDPGDAALAATIAAKVATAPGCTLLLGHASGEPVARAMALVRGETAGVYNVYVQPALRGRGLGAAMTAATMEAARRGGARVVGLQATAEGLGLYRRMGFAPLYDLVSLCRPA